ncbi:MAG: UDP-N-acetylmuramoyl-tripeptide--D-alanyl-D-alanine ligase [bacterium]|nr:UDP-N-acetylmuramoyl-tripeptide--D-alanyl-D-alanine ligase [bacterium]MDN5835666.1 UDP-N-acetylmuramoyl-tripeptide--D-alanyl-D-alanine ligase [bacterium]
MFRKIIKNKLQKYVRKYFIAHPEVKLVIVAGSVGKTSTKVATATILSSKYRVRLHEGNHNTDMSAPLAILGVGYPLDVRSVVSWLKVFSAARKRIKRPADVDVIIQELGADHPGDIQGFAEYLNPDIAIITAVTAEHMEHFGDMAAVAKEELEAANFSKMAVINRDDIEGKYANYLTNANVTTYGTSGIAEYRFEEENFTLENGYQGNLIAPEFDTAVDVQVNVVGEHNIRPVIGAAAVGVKLGMSKDEIARGMADVLPVAGRMNLLPGVQGTTIIDDTYNSSPLAAQCAIQTLYKLQAPQRILIMGSMNELGPVSAVEHEKLGKMCDPNAIAWVITVGDEAERYFAPAAKSNGCQVQSFKTSLEAGAFAHKVLEEGAIILGKGSETGIYVEEALKIILRTTAEQDNLVRQSDAWKAEKNKFFSKFA